MELHRSLRPALLLYLHLLLIHLPAPAEAQYEQYSFKSFPQKDIMPLDAAYSYALEQYGAQNWAESIKFLELSLRLHRLLRDSEAFCSRNCSSVSRDGDSPLLRRRRRRPPRRAPRPAEGCVPQEVQGELPGVQPRVPTQGHAGKFREEDAVSVHPVCVLPVFHSLSHKNSFSTSVHSFGVKGLNNLEKAVAAAHTFLKKNPTDPYLTKNMKYYKTLFDVEEYLVDHEEQPYESVFLKSVMLYNSGDFSSSARNMEQAITQYFEIYKDCLAGCEGSYERSWSSKTSIPLWQVRREKYLYTDVLKCKVHCEEHLTPSVGGFFVEKFVATMYHYLQFSYYKLNDVKNAAPCAASYMLFDKKDQVMQQNVAYYRFYREQWGLEDSDFEPRAEALRYFNETTKQKEMLEFALNYLQTDDEDVVSPEETGTTPSEHPDSEFEGMGDYEESFLAEWWQEPKTKWDTGEVAD
ncbi:hypothetical protein L3Q82_014022 [Scortum barcoo]|uniref:Uncharacterized protein n=1 Tax=Scortum barcoo TaxID=214431 RepID=A0ACB8VW08_9TELE|nr:hypothetical protein L3Q82_014022 [Scortum barcoo]